MLFTFCCKQLRYVLRTIAASVMDRAGAPSCQLTLLNVYVMMAGQELSAQRVSSFLVISSFIVLNCHLINSLIYTCKLLAELHVVLLLFEMLILIYLESKICWFCSASYKCILA